MAHMYHADPDEVPEPYRLGIYRMLGGVTRWGWKLERRFGRDTWRDVATGRGFLTRDAACEAGQAAVNTRIVPDHADIRIWRDPACMDGTLYFQFGFDGELYKLLGGDLELVSLGEDRAPELGVPGDWIDLVPEKVSK